jgi:hypothetical protein
VRDITREREGQENVFQELQQAIDFLDHAPAGFMSIDPDGSVPYLNATLAGWLDYDLAKVGSGGLLLKDIAPVNAVAMVSAIAGKPGEVRTEVVDVDLRRRNGQSAAGAPAPRGRFRAGWQARRLAHAGAQPHARRGGGRCRHGCGGEAGAVLQQHADGDCHCWG